MISIIRRDDKTISVTVKNSAGNPINLTGYTVFFTVKSNAQDVDADAVISKTITNHTDAVNGLTSVTLTHSDTDIEEGDYIYDFQLKDGSGNISSSQRDVLSVANDVTIRTS